MTDDVRRLVLLRHSKSERPPGVQDHARGLAPRGRADAAAVGRWLGDHDLVPDLVLCSDAVRARQTWEVAGSGLGEVPTRWEERLYEASPDSVVGLVAEAPDEAGTVLVVGHEPTLSAVADGLAGPGSDGGLLARVRAHLPTSGVVVLELPGPWQGVEAGSCRLVAFEAPRG